MGRLCIGDCVGQAREFQAFKELMAGIVLTALKTLA